MGEQRRGEMRRACSTGSTPIMTAISAATNSPRRTPCAAARAGPIAGSMRMGPPPGGPGGPGMGRPPAGRTARAAPACAARGMFGEQGFVTREQMRERALARFDRADANHDGTLTAAERQQAREQMRRAVPKSRRPNQAARRGAGGPVRLAPAFSSAIAGRLISFKSFRRHSWHCSRAFRFVA